MFTITNWMCKFYKTQVPTRYGLTNCSCEIIIYVINLIKEYYLIYKHWFGKTNGFIKKNCKLE